MPLLIIFNSVLDEQKGMFALLRCSISISFFSSKRFLFDCPLLHNSVPTVLLHFFYVGLG